MSRRLNRKSGRLEGFIVLGVFPATIDVLSDKPDVLFDKPDVLSDKPDVLSDMPDVLSDMPDVFADKLGTMALRPSLSPQNLASRTH